MTDKPEVLLYGDGTPRRMHELKVWPEFFDALESGEKPFELRKNDRDFGAGDHLWLREWHFSSGYSGRSLNRIVTYVLVNATDFGLMPGFAALGLRPWYGR